MKRVNKDSFTLVEVMVVLAILSLVFGIILYFLIVGEENLSIIDTRVTLQQGLRRCMRQISDDLSDSTMTTIVDDNDQPFNLVTKDASSGELECLPSGSECVYYTIKFKKPQSRDGNGEVDSWSNYIYYNLNSNSITKTESGNTTVLLDDIDLIEKSSSADYTHDPNLNGSGFLKLGGANQIKIILVAEKENARGRNIRIKVGRIIHLRN
ncbi:MAG: prepilin-type N-terminal cleavage/methylation domain-containing protein [Candidatus Omnitrophica bacterium]|nr:prepilin-type N-terminal cleavage/methylation domain-containing protein [Candidatus Omnitrophota bacterium]